MTFVFDACSLIAYLRDEAGADVVEALLLDRHNVCLIHAVNLCEVYYDFLRVSNEQVAQEAVTDLLTCWLGHSRRYGYFLLARGGQTQSTTPCFIS